MNCTSAGEGGGSVGLVDGGNVLVGWPGAPGWTTTGVCCAETDSTNKKVTVAVAIKSPSMEASHYHKSIVCGYLRKPAQTPKPALVAAASPARYRVELKQFDDFVARQMQFDKTPGLTIGFIQDDFVWVKGYGFADLENKVPAKPESAYRLASVTKPALAIMQLVEKKKIDLDAEVQT